FLLPGFVVLIAAFFDILDGALARRTNQTTHFGAVLDSTLDRLAEAVVLLGILFLYAREQAVAEILLVSLALLGSLLVSYIRARAEAVGLECQVGLFTRAERVIVLALGLLLNQIDFQLNLHVLQQRHNPEVHQLKRNQYFRHAVFHVFQSIEFL
ncbi:unnamed protein product, partial [marine sediment metagenome]